jgi:alpha-glucoside transport system substrate-binding protein
LPLDELVELARGLVTRSLTSEECDAHGIAPCPVDGNGLAAPAAAGPGELPSPAAAARSVTTSAESPLAGPTVTLWVDGYTEDGLFDELSVFEELTGVNVQYRTVQYDAASVDSMEPGERPDLLLLGAAPVRELARRGALVELSPFLDEASARRAHGNHLIDVVSDGSGFYGIPDKLGVKGLVWYPEPEFEAAGYTVPRTWDELIALSDQMVADGRHPWCLGLESGVATGWPATDWIEALVLRLGGVELYDQWVAHEIPFDHPVVRQATSMFGEIAFSPGYVDSGLGSINGVMFNNAALPMYDDPPGCWLHYMAGFTATGMPPGTVAGIDAGFFELPPVTAGEVVPTLGDSSFVAAIRDRPEVRALVRHISSPAWGATWAGQPLSTFAPANVEFDPEHCRTSMWLTTVDPGIGDLRVRVCAMVRDSIVAGTWRLDGSDLMPSTIGSDLFWAGIVDYIDSGPTSVDAILADIEAGWPDG